MTIDLEGLSPAQLNKLISDANAQMAAARASEVAKTREKIDAILASAGLTIDEVYARRGRKGGKVGRRAGAGVPKYRNPKNAEETWSGMGKRPRWLADALAGGAKLESFAIGAQPVKPAASKPSRKVVAKKAPPKRGTRGK